MRFLLKQNLDVNMAVNNLLSRDDEGEGEEEDSQDSYMPDDLISLLDNGIHSDHTGVIIDADTMFNEDLFGYSTPRSRGSGTRSRLGVYRGIFIVILYVHTLTQTLCSATPHPGVVDLAPAPDSVCIVVYL